MKNRTMRSAFIRVSALNHATKDNKKLGVKEGDVIEYSLDDILNTIDDWQKTKKFEYFIIEHNDKADKADKADKDDNDDKADKDDNDDKDEKENNRHWHIVLSFPNKSSCTFNTLKNKFPYGHIDNCRTGVKNCVRYLTHADNPEKTQYEWTAILTNAPDKLEMYKAASKTNLNVETKIVVDKIIDGEIKPFQIDKISPEIYIKKRTAIKNAFEYREQILLTDPNRHIVVYVLQGESRIGKTTFAKEWAKKNEKSICFSSASRDPWQDYGGQDIFVYDDFDYNSIKIDDFKKALDPHTNTSMSRRYRNTLFIGDTIFICTNTPIGEWFIGDEESSREAVFKRIDYVLDFKKFEDFKISEDLSLIQDWEIPEYSEGSSYYTVNKIISTGEYMNICDDRGKVVNNYRVMRLAPVDNKIRKFELSKLFNIISDEDKNADFVKKLDEI